MTIDLAATIDPKSLQLNADDLIGGPRTITITKVARAGTDDQPIDVYFDGDNGKPYKPCKGMRRIMVQLWGRDGAKYVGRSMTLYRDDSVKWGGVDVGGIRISHMSDINEPITVALTASKTSRKPFTVRPLKIEKKRAVAEPPADDLATKRAAMVEHFKSLNISTERICSAVGKTSVDLIDGDDIATLKGYATEIKSGEKSILERFPQG